MRNNSIYRISFYPPYFCVEWTPGKGFYIAAKNTDSHKSGQAHSDNDISN